MDKLKVGLVSSSQLSFPGNKKAVFSSTSAKVGRLAQEWDFDLYVYPRDVIVAEDGYEAVKALEDEKVDFVLLQCTSFSAGFLAPIFARTKNAFLGLWAIPEFAQEGAVPFNSFCSINMYSGIIGHYLNGYKVPLKWYFGDVEDPLFLERFRITIRAQKAIRQMKHAKIALVGGIAPGFDDLYDDERNIIKLFDGIRINRLHEYGELRDLALSIDQESVAERVKLQLAEAKGINPKASGLMELNARFAIAYERFAAANGYDAIAISCWPKSTDEFKYSICAVVGELNDKGIVAACEGDLTSAISMLFLKYLAEDETMLMDMSAFDQNDDSILLWHCGPAGKRFCEKSGFTLGLNYSGMPHDPNRTEPNGNGVTRDMVFDPGKVTIARLTGESDTMFVAGGEILDGTKKSFHGSRGWVGSLQINRQPVSALNFINTVLVQRFQHHFPIVKGDYTKEVMEAMAWMGLKKIEIVPYEDFMQNPTIW